MSKELRRVQKHPSIPWPGFDIHSPASVGQSRSGGKRQPGCRPQAPELGRVPGSVSNTSPGAEQRCRTANPTSHKKLRCFPRTRCPGLRTLAGNPYPRLRGKKEDDNCLKKANSWLFFFSGCVLSAFICVATDTADMWCRVWRQQTAWR